MTALLDAAGRVLEDHGFAVHHELLPSTDKPWVLAENEFFALGVLSGESLETLEESESLASQVLLDRLGGLYNGAKRWDAYIVLLTSQPRRNVDERYRVGMVYNTRGARRIVGMELTPDEASVMSALAPFLPLTEPIGSGLESLDAALVDALVVNGVPMVAAERYVAAYRRTKALDDI